MRKKIAIITNAKEIREALKEQLEFIFEELIEVKVYSLEDKSINKLEESDLYLITSSAYEFLDNNFLRKKNIVIASLTLTKNIISQLKKFPKGQKIVFFNVSFKMCIETISMMYHLGINNIDFIPAYPQMMNFPKGNIIITPGEKKLLPENTKNRKIIDIGHRIIDVNTIIEIAIKLELEYILYYKKIKEYLETVATNTDSLNKILERAALIESQFSILKNVTKSAILGVDKNNLICFCNNRAEKILKKTNENLIGNSAEEILEMIPFSEVKESKKEINSKLIKIGGEYITLNIIPIIRVNNYMGAFAIFQEFKEEERKQNEYRKQFLNKGHRAKYFFENILGENKKLKEMLELAKRFSKTNIDILITGESGTGKEILAHAIHNESNRKEYPFVAINCAAIPTQLLESELFGYEEGAFTGAKRGGKTGLIEIANKGTLFLDELEGMSPELQVKLLRVIQEKEIMRIGGEKVINVDVRIIATTNEELRKLIDSGKFRKDLYYRISAFPLNIPPLRERKDDIEFLIEKFKIEKKLNLNFSLKAKKALKKYNWDGNIRELKNYVEFFGFLNKNIIEFDDLPIVIKENYEMENILGKEKYEKIFGKKYEKYIFVLEKINELNMLQKSSGRKRLLEECKKTKIEATEQEIRGILKYLNNQGLIISYKGRKGNEITEMGKEVLFLEK